MAVLDLGKVTMTDEEINGIIDEKLHGYSFYENPEVIHLVAGDTPYQDSSGKYILASGATGQGLIQDSATYKIAALEGNYYSVGADTLSPFKSGGGDSIIESPLVIPINVDAAGVTASTSTFDIPLAVHNPAKLIVKSLTLRGVNESASAKSQYLNLYIYGIKEDGSKGTIKSFGVGIAGTTWSSINFKDYEVDLTGFKSVERISVVKSLVAGTGYTMRFCVTGSVELYF